MSRILVTKTYEFWTEARRVLPRLFGADRKSTTSVISRIWNVSKVTPYRWGANRRTNEDWCHNPHDLLTNTHEELIETGNRWLVEASLRLLADPCGFKVSDAEVVSDKVQPHLEIMDINQALGELCAAHTRHISDSKYTLEEMERDLVLAARVERQTEELQEAIKSMISVRRAELDGRLHG